MAGQIVHAVICPEGTDPSILKEIYGDKWPDEFPSAVQEDSGSSVTYVLAQKSEFATINEPKEIVLKDGKTKIQVVTGELKSGAKSDGVIDVSVDTVSNTYEWNVTLGEFIDDEVWKFQRILWAALAQDSSTMDQRSRIIMGALDSLKASIQKALTKAGEQIVNPPSSTKSDMPFGSGEVLSKLVSELKGIKRYIAEQTKNEVTTATNTEQSDNLQGGIEDMSNDYATKEEFNGLKDGLSDLSKKFDTLMEKLTPKEEPAVQAATPQPETSAKSEADIIAEKVGEMIKPLAEKLEAVESKVNDTAAKTEILQKSGPSGSVAEDTSKPANSTKSDCSWATHSAFAGRM